MPLGRHRRDWEDLAIADPLWAVSGKRGTFHTPWGVDEFLATGEAEIDAVLGHAHRLGRPRRHERALDFGCGIGRITRALAQRFEWCEAVDISEGMIEQARANSRGFANCAFFLNEQPGLELFPDERFDFAYSSFVLQHMPNRRVAAQYIRELIRVTRPDGVLVFQMPDRIPLLGRLQVRRRAYALLRRLGLSGSRLQLLQLNPVRMIALPQREVADLVRRGGGSVILSEPVDATKPLAGYRYYVQPGPISSAPSRPSG